MVRHRCCQPASKPATLYHNDHTHKARTTHADMLSISLFVLLNIQMCVQVCACGSVWACGSIALHFVSSHTNCVSRMHKNIHSHAVRRQGMLNSSVNSFTEFQSHWVPVPVPYDINSHTHYWNWLKWTSHSKEKQIAQKRKIKESQAIIEISSCICTIVMAFCCFNERMRIKIKWSKKTNSQTKKSIACLKTIGNDWI